MDNICHVKELHSVGYLHGNAHHLFHRQLSFFHVQQVWVLTNITHQDGRARATQTHTHIPWTITSKGSSGVDNWYYLQKITYVAALLTHLRPEQNKIEINKRFVTYPQDCRQRRVLWQGRALEYSYIFPLTEQCLHDWAFAEFELHGKSPAVVDALSGLATSW